MQSGGWPANHAERALNKGRGLKIGRDHHLARYHEKRIADEGYSPDAELVKI